jgi:hypothetical protein
MHIKLTENFYIESKSIDIIEWSERSGEPWVEVWTKRQDVSELHFRGDEANEAWANWKAHMQLVEDERRRSAEADVPKMEPGIMSEDQNNEEIED